MQTSPGAGGVGLAGTRGVRRNPRCWRPARLGQTALLLRDGPWDGSLWRGGFVCIDRPPPQPHVLQPVLRILTKNKQNPPKTKTTPPPQKKENTCVLECWLTVYCSF